ncbi:phospholipase D-like domain-containing protein [Methylacidimicrobium tartarophylax]|uniref:Phospholipase D-like domain-containing protein n=1 Tax=Methylacidimicrobium tartarophylax TaxID=1041768 RepID=A0A5E6MP01_9BACT|nr:phospholipase D-like domain-containing protein [Methylacidimicrobium tartarophylax]VVM07724.1 hypothetical protein MAMT_01883 [Methylacidimicrobium tartarophylax]
MRKPQDNACETGKLKREIAWFYNQPLAIRLGTKLQGDVDRMDNVGQCWDTLDIAVAWVRESGMRHLSERLASFLRNGGELSVIVGIDLENTTREGLQALLNLECCGQCETFVYHNEAGSVFHPKVYLFRNEEEARLIVGSNNITESGLYVNVEAGLQVDATADAEVVVEVQKALSSWKDTTSGLAKRLDKDFLANLVREGYVPDEAAAREKIRRESTIRPRKGAAALFGSRTFEPPPPIRSETSPVGPSGVRALRPSTPTPVMSAGQIPSGTVLLMRLRKASATASATGRPTQTQIPFRVVNTFFNGATEVRSIHSGVAHGIHEASARGNPNTTKLEIPEMRDFAQPVARFEKTSQGIVYEAYDVDSPKGHQIMESLEEGRNDGSTQLSIGNPERATWWRFI